MKIESLDVTTGNGVSIIDGNQIQIPFAAIDDEVKVQITSIKDDNCTGEIIEILKRGPKRAEPKCEYFGKCGGCQLQHLHYEEQLRFKEERLKNLFQVIQQDYTKEKFDKLFQPIVPCSMTYGYRSKITPHFQKPIPNMPLNIGFLMRNKKKTMDIKSCVISSKEINEEYTRVREKVLAERGKYKKGVSLILRETVEKDGSINVLTNPTSLCNEIIDGKTFTFPVSSFFQVNREMIEKVIKFVIQEIGHGKVDYLLDCYSGPGLFALALAPYVQQVYSIEVAPVSTFWGQMNAKQNFIYNLQILTGDSKEIFQFIPRRVNPKKTAVIIDPSRPGCTQDFIDALLKFQPKTIVYVSCNPETQVRDVKSMISSKDYEITKIVPFDFFPQTLHLESVVILERLPENNSN